MNVSNTLPSFRFVSEDNFQSQVVITPDYRLLHMVQKLSDGADAHRVAEEMNHYVLAIQVLNESKSNQDRAMLDGIRRRAETNLRVFVARKMQATVPDNL